jgi:hypothetical protein
MSLELESHEHQVESFALWMPDPDEPIVIESFAEAASLAFEVLDMPAEREVLVLLDERRAITAVVLDAPPPVGVFIGRCDLPGLEVSFCQTLSIVLKPVREGPPSADDRRGYQNLRRLHVLQGLQLLDVIEVDAERLRSLAIACDPDPVWFEPFEPMAPAPYHRDP